MVVGGVCWYVGSRLSRPAQSPVNSSTFSRPNAVDATQTNGSFNWRQVESADYRTYIANLRAIGCPEETIRDIVIADVNKLFAARKMSLLNPAPWKYWQSSQPETRQLSRSKQQQLLELENERRTLVTTLLGPKADDELVRMESYERWQRLEFLPQEKRSEVLKVENRFKAQRQAIYNEAEQCSSAPDWKRLRELHLQRESELASLLSPQDLFEYQLRNDDVAERLRQNLVGFDLTESEFRELFGLQKAHEERFNFLDPLDETAQIQAADDQSRADEEIKAFLGDERYAQYRRGNDPHFRDLYSLTQQFDLPADTAGMLYDRHRRMQDEISRLQSDPALTPGDRDNALRSYQAEIDSLLKQSLGEAAYARFQAGTIERFLGN